MTPSASSRSSGCSPYGAAPRISTAVTPFLRLCLDLARQQQVQHRHPDGDPVGHLFHDHRTGAVGDLRGDLHAAVHRAGVQHDAVRRDQRAAALVQPVGPAVFAGGREERAAHPFPLHPQHHHRVRADQRRVQVVGHLHRPGLHAHRQQRRRRHQRDLGTQGGQQQHVGPGDPGVQHVADDDDPPAGQRAQVPAQRVRVEQRLGRVLVGAVTGVDHVPVDPGRQLLRRTGRGMPADHRVGAHRLQRPGGVLQRLALGHRRALGGEGDDVGGQPLGGQLEGDPGPGGVLEEQVDHGAAAQGRELAHLPPGDRLLEPLRGGQHVLGGRPVQVGGRQQVPGQRDRTPAPRGSTATAGRPRGRGRCAAGPAPAGRSAGHARLPS